MHYTMKDIARECGVGVMTVSRAFKNDASISDETRKKILETAQKYSYTPNLSARSLKAKGANIIGWMVPNTNNTFYYDLIPLIQKKLIAKNYSLVLSFVTPETNEISAFNELLTSRPEVVMVSNKTIPNLILEKKIKTDTKLIGLFTRMSHGGIPKINIDDIKGVRIATEYLISNGHKKISFIGANRRVDGYKSVMAEHGFPFENLYFNETNENITALSDFLIDKVPTAAISFGRWNTLLYAALALSNKKIPEDTSVIMFDDNELARLLDIDVIKHELNDLTDKIVQLIINTINNPNTDTPESIIVDPILVKRKSVKNLNIQ